MYAMIIVILDETLLKRIVSILIELELFDATILDGEAPETVAVETLPVFKELAGILHGDSVYNKTIICHAQEERQVKKFIKICKEEGIDFTEEDTGWVMALKCDYFVGF